jgi:Rrf2 family protein
MKVSAQEEYGLRCLLTLAREGENAFLTIPEISRREGLTPSHVAKLLAILRRNGFVKSTRGQSGGYSLAAPADDIPVHAVLAALGGRLFDHRFCDRHSGLLPACSHGSECQIRPLWFRIQSAVESVLDGLTLQDLTKGPEAPASPESCSPLSVAHSAPKAR